MMGGACPRLSKEYKMDRYFKKADGFTFKYNPSNHDLKALKSRFKECDENGKEMKPKAKKKKN
jgi:hypothetical protein